MRIKCVTDTGIARRGRMNLTVPPSQPPRSQCVSATKTTLTTVSVLQTPGAATTTSVLPKLTGVMESLSVETLLTSQHSVPPVLADYLSPNLTVSVTASRTVSTLLTNSPRLVAVLRAAGVVTIPAWPTTS